MSSDLKAQIDKLIGQIRRFEINTLTAADQLAALVAGAEVEPAIFRCELCGYEGSVPEHIHGGEQATCPRVGMSARERALVEAGRAMIGPPSRDLKDWADRVGALRKALAAYPPSEKEKP